MVVIQRRCQKVGTNTETIKGTDTTATMKRKRRSGRHRRVQQEARHNLTLSSRTQTKKEDHQTIQCLVRAKLKKLTRIFKEMTWKRAQNETKQAIQLSHNVTLKT